MSGGIEDIASLTGRAHVVSFATAAATARTALVAIEVKGTHKLLGQTGLSYTHLGPDHHVPILRIALVAFVWTAPETLHASFVALLAGAGDEALVEAFGTSVDAHAVVQDVGCEAPVADQAKQSELAVSTARWTGEADIIIPFLYEHIAHITILQTGQALPFIPLFTAVGTVVRFSHTAHAGRIAVGTHLSAVYEEGLAGT